MPLIRPSDIPGAQLHFVLLALLKIHRFEMLTRVAERAVFYIRSLKQMQMNYELVQEAYGIRAKTIHGGLLSKKNKSRDYNDPTIQLTYLPKLMAYFA